MDKGISEGILDIGRQLPVTGSKIFAALKGVIDVGVNCPHDDEKIPNEDRILGKHLNKEIMTAVTDIKGGIIGGA